MNVKNLIKMANQIENFFRSEPNREMAISGIENHLRRFWDPRMRKEIVKHVGQGGEGLGDMAKAAVQRLAAPSAQ